MNTTLTSAQQAFLSRGTRRRGRRRWTATPGRPRRGWIRSSGARGNLWSRGATAREAYGSLPRAPAATTARRGSRRRRRRLARSSGRCSRRKETAGGSSGPGGGISSRRRKSARCAWRISARETFWRASPARTASTGPAPCGGSAPPPAAPSAAPPSASPPTPLPADPPELGRHSWPAGPLRLRQTRAHNTHHGVATPAPARERAVDAMLWPASCGAQEQDVEPGRCCC